MKRPDYNSETLEELAKFGIEPAPSRSRLRKCLPFNVRMPSRARKQAVSSNFASSSLVLAHTFVELHDGHVPQVSIELVIVQAEPHHETVGDLEAAIVHRHLHDAARVAIQKRAHRKRVGRPSGQRLQ